MKKDLKRTKENQKAFTLIELILIVALMAVSIGVTNDILLSLIRSNNKTQVINEIEQQSNFVSLKIEKELRNARSVSIPAPGSSGKILNFLTRSGHTIQYEVDDNGVMWRSVDGGGKLGLTSNNAPGGVLVTCGTGGCFSVSGFNPQITNFSVSFSQAQPGTGGSYSGSVGINSTIGIRNTY